MGFLGFGSKKEPPRDQAETAPIECPHVLLSPRWDSVADIGHEDKAVGYKCNSCGASLTVEEGHEAQRRHIVPAV